MIAVETDQTFAGAVMLTDEPGLIVYVPARMTATQWQVIWDWTEEVLRQSPDLVGGTEALDGLRRLKPLPETGKPHSKDGLP